MKKHLVTKALGGWSFHIGITKEQAVAILNATNGDVIKLDGDKETITVASQILRYSKTWENYVSFEDLHAADVKMKIRELIEQDVWAQDKE